VAGSGATGRCRTPYGPMRSFAARPRWLRNPPCRSRWGREAYQVTVEITEIGATFTVKARMNAIAMTNPVVAEANIGNVMAAI